MENQQIPPASNQLDNFFNIAFDEATRAQIRKAASWAKICTLCAFAGYAVTLVVAFFAPQSEVMGSSNGAALTTTVRTTSIIGVLVSVAIGVFINYFLYRFATAAAKGMDAMDSTKTNEGFNGLRIYFKILGIFLIIGLCIGALAMLGALIGMGMGAR